MQGHIPTMDDRLVSEFIRRNRFVERYEEGMNHTRNVNVPAITANATPACAARADTVPSTSAPPELLPDEAVAFPVELAAAAEPELERGETPDEEASLGVEMELDGATEEVTGSTTLEEGAAEVLFEPVPGVVVFPPVRYGGAATAEDGSTRAPFPHGIASPSGWFGLGAGTVLPVESEIVKRPVQVLVVGSEGVENW